MTPRHTTVAHGGVRAVGHGRGRGADRCRADGRRAAAEAAHGGYG